MPELHTPALAHPRYWSQWAIVATGWLVAQLPWWLLLALGRGIGHLFWWLGGTRKQVALINIRLCFAELSEEQQRKLAHQTLVSTGEAFTETIGAYFNRHVDLPSRLTIEGLENYEAARASGRGIILLGMHFNTIDVASRLSSRAIHMHAVYRPNNNPVMDWVIRKGRSQSMAGYIDRQDLRGMIRTLRKGETVWYAPDQFYGLEHAVFAPFFGVPAATITATSRLAKMGNALVVPAAHFRLPGGRYLFSFSPALENFPSGDELADTTRINAAIEKEVRKAPEQYLWVHRRFKRMPDGSNPYGRHVRHKRRRQ